MFTLLNLDKIKLLEGLPKSLKLALLPHLNNVELFKEINHYYKSFCNIVYRAAVSGELNGCHFGVQTIESPLTLEEKPMWKIDLAVFTIDATNLEWKVTPNYKEINDCNLRIEHGTECDKEAIYSRYYIPL